MLESGRQHRPWLDGGHAYIICVYVQVRRVEVDTIRAHLRTGEIVLLGALGYSASGDVFNVKSEEVAW